MLLTLAPCTMCFHYKVVDVLPISRALETLSLNVLVLKLTNKTKIYILK